MATVALREVTKSFVVRHNANHDLKVQLLGLVHARHREEREVRWALRGVDLEVERGECLGLVGPNGSGKSTLLRLMAGIFRPTSGEVRVSGRVAPVIELGVGFNGELTGRENLYLGAALFGLSRPATRAIYQQVVDFAELGDAMDLPMKNYSTGMYARLGYALAAHLEAELLLVDEVLAVGDEHFQRKCMEHMDRLRGAGRTLVVVSHDLGAITRLCDRVGLLVDGRLVRTGPPGEVVADYRELVAAAGP